MPSYIVKLQEFYFEYSTIVDAPTIFGMNLDDFKKYYQEMYGLNGMKNLDDRLKRVHATGTSSQRIETPAQILLGNKAGPNKEELTIDEIYQAYCLRKPIKGGWMVPTIDDYSG